MDFKLTHLLCNVYLSVSSESGLPCADAEADSSPWTLVLDAPSVSVGKLAVDLGELVSSREHLDGADTWTDILFEFCQNTSIHALRQMTEPTPYLARR